MADTPIEIKPILRAHRGPERRGRPPKNDGTLVSAYERAVKSAADNVVSAHKAIRQAMGDRPFRKRKIGEVDRLHRYLAVKDNPLYWGAIIQTQGIGPALKYAIEMETIAKAHPEHGKYLSPESFD